MSLNESTRPVTDIEIDALCAQPLHLVVDGPGHNIPRRQLHSFVKARHEAVPVSQRQRSALATQCLGHQKRFAARVKKTGGVKLIELEVGDTTSGSPCSGNTVTAGAVGVGRITIRFACAACG